MGIDKLLPHLKWWRQRVSLRMLARSKPEGITVGVDGHVWLHEFVSKHARSVLIDKDYSVIGKELIERCRLFISWGISPIIVFDGKLQPMKDSTNEARARRRIKHKAEVERLVSLNDDDLIIDESLLKSAVSIDESLVLSVIDALRVAGWKHYIRSPFEGDGQLAKLAISGKVDYVLTIDSDLLVYCPRVLMRMNSGGYCDLYDSSLLTPPAEEANEEDVYDIDAADGIIEEEDASGVADRSNRLQQLMLKHGSNETCMWFGLLTKNDYSNVPNSGPASAICVMEVATKQGDFTVDSILAAVDEQVKVVEKRKRGNVRWRGPVQDELRVLFEKALFMFKHQLVFDVDVKQFVPLSGDMEKLHDARAGLSHFTFLDDTSETRNSWGWSQGFLEANGTHRDPPMFEHYFEPGNPFSLRITPEMVKGAVLKYNGVDEVSRNTMEDLSNWLKTRNQPSSGNKPQLVTRVTDQMALEAVQEKSEIRVYDRTGEALTALKNNEAHSWLFPDRNALPPQLNSTGWFGIDSFPRHAPVLPEHAIQEFYKDQGAMLNPNIRVLEEGLALIQGRNYLSQLRCHFVGTSTAWLFMQCPATMKSQSYPVFAKLLCFERQGAEPPRVIKIEQVYCGFREQDGKDGCKARRIKCIHGSALLQVLQNTLRPADLKVACRDVPATAKCCRWNHPGDGDMADPLQPAACLVVKKTVRLKGNKRATHVALRNDVARQLYKPLTEEDEASRGSMRSNPMFCEKLAALYSTIEKASNGRKCCAELVWGVPKSEEQAAVEPTITIAPTRHTNSAIEPIDLVSPVSLGLHSFESNFGQMQSSYISPDSIGLSSSDTFSGGLRLPDINVPGAGAGNKRQHTPQTDTHAHNTRSRSRKFFK